MGQGQSTLPALRLLLLLMESFVHTCSVCHFILCLCGWCLLLPSVCKLSESLCPGLLNLCFHLRLRLWSTSLTSKTLALTQRQSRTLGISQLRSLAFFSTTSPERGLEEHRLIRKMKVAYLRKSRRPLGLGSKQNQWEEGRICTQASYTLEGNFSLL